MLHALSRNSTNVCPIIELCRLFTGGFEGRKPRFDWSWHVKHDTLCITWTLSASDIHSVLRAFKPSKYACWTWNATEPESDLCLSLPSECLFPPHRYLADSSLWISRESISFLIEYRKELLIQLCLLLKINHSGISW